jgi:hypothetical protein
VLVLLTPVAGSTEAWIGSRISLGGLLHGVV